MMDDLRKKYYVCIDIGGTAIKYGLADENGVFADKGSVRRRRSNTADRALWKRLER